MAEFAGFWSLLEACCALAPDFVLRCDGDVVRWEGTDWAGDRRFGTMPVTGNADRDWRELHNLLLRAQYHLTARRHNWER